MDGSDLAERAERIGSELFAAAVDPERWQSAMARLAELGGGPAHVYGSDLVTGAPLLTASAGHDPDSVHSYAEHYAKLNPFARVAPQIPVGRPVTHTEAVPEEELLRTQFYNEWLRPQGHLYGGGGVQLFRSDQVVVSCSVIYDGRLREARQADTMALITRLTPVLRHAWMVNQRLAGGALERAVLKRERTGDPAVVVLDGTGRTAFVNATGQTELARGSALAVDSGGRVRLGDAAAQSTLSYALWVLRQGAAPEPATVAFDQEGRRLSVTLSRFQEETLDGWQLGATLGLTGRHLLLTLADIGEEPDLVSELRAHRNLAQAEAEVAVSLWQGLDTSGVADARQVSIHTVRNQIKSAAAKCGVRRQAELVALVGRLHADLQTPE